MKWSGGNMMFYRHPELKYLTVYCEDVEYVDCCDTGL